MSAIAGVVRTTPEDGLDGRLERMLETMAHRGPDGKAVWVDPSGACGLAQNKLNVIEPEEGHELLTNEDETLWITFDGCIYNYQDIARLLRQKGHRFRTHGDTEVILHAYEEWGPDCVKHFNGVWAVAIWDSRSKILFCSRDRLGVKPFYYAWDGAAFTFASEIKAILAAGALQAEVSRDGLRQYLTFQFCLGETTLFQGVQRLLPGHNLTLQHGQPPHASRYWDIAFAIDEKHDETYFVDKLNWLLGDAVRLRLRADVPLGVYLSGGLDSSTALCLTRLLLGDDIPIKTFTGAFREGAAFDETRYARLAAAAAGSEYIETYVSAQDFAPSIEKIIWHLDEPAAGPGVFPQYWVSKLASQHVKVVIGGEGGDELFIGYARYLVAYLEECLKGAIEDTARRGHYVATLESLVPTLPMLENYVPMLRSFWQEGLFAEPARRYFRLMDRFADAQKLLSPGLDVDQERTFLEFHSIFESHGAAAMINRILCFDLKAHLQALLHIDDRMSAAWGLEGHVPFLDYRLVELVAAVPPVIKFRNGQLKYLFRQSIRNVIPQEILNRKDKMGFPVPLTRWLQGELRGFVADVLLSQRCRERGIFDPQAIEATLSSEQPYGRSIWGALCLELWHRRFVDGVQ